MADDLAPTKIDALVSLLTDSLVNLKDERGDATVTTPDGKVISQKEWAAWDWNQGVALTVLYNHTTTAPSESTAKSLATILAWFEAQYAATNGAGAPKNINTMAPLYSLASLLQDRKTDDARWKAWVAGWGAWSMDGLARTREGGMQHVTYRTDNKDQLWADTLFMTVLPLARIGVLLNKPTYLEEVKYQVLTHIRYLADSSGLFYHGWVFTDDGGHNFANALWARGNSWITYAIPLLLEVMGLDEGDATRRFMVSSYKRQVDALLAVQDKGGLWHTILDDTFSYLEVSGSAGFAAGIICGVRTGVLPQSYLPAAQRALSAILPNISPDGEVQNVSYGTPIGDSIQFYKDIPLISMPYGQGLVMAALVEWKKWLEVEAKGKA